MLTQAFKSLPQGSIVSLSIDWLWFVNGLSNKPPILFNVLMLTMLPCGLRKNEVITRNAYSNKIYTPLYTHVASAVIPINN